MRLRQLLDVLPLLVTLDGDLLHLLPFIEELQLKGLEEGRVNARL